MMIPNLSLKDLEYIVSVAQHKHFSRAAEACAVSQPALSKQIKLLEQTLNIRIFERNNRQVLLTELGERFVQQAILVLDEASKLSTITNNTLPLEGNFRLGAIASSGPYLIPYFIGSLKKRYPKLNLIVKEGLTATLVQELKQGKLDAIIAAPTFEEPTFASFKLFFEPFVLASPKAEKVKKQLSIKKLELKNLLLLEDGHCLKDQTLDFCRMKKNEQNFKLQASSIETLLHMTASELGHCIIPQLAISKNPQLNALLNISWFSDEKIGRTMTLYYRKSFHDIDSIQTLSSLIQGSIAT